MGVFDLSLRHKIPLWGSLLIVASALAISTALLFRAYDDLKQDLFISSESLGQTLAKTLFPALLHDDLWRAFEIVHAPFHSELKNNPLEAESIFVVNDAMQILVASDPGELPTLSDMASIGPEYRRLATELRLAPLTMTRAYDFPEARHYYIATPIAEAGRQIGILVISHDQAAFWQRFLDMTVRSMLIGLLVVAVILPINWYWGRRMAEPLVDLARGMDAMMQGKPVPLPTAENYSYRDELGQLFAAYRKAAAALNEKTLLEQEMVRTERLAAVGRLASGIAHEVNNPLGGMLMALDTLKQRGQLDTATTKTAALLERGLQQIAETVGALLVEARVPARRLTKQDCVDVHTLIEPQIRKKRIKLDWHCDMPEVSSLSAGLVRQILINLLLNAVQATNADGHIMMEAIHTEKALRLTVTNTGEPLPEAVRKHLFEPFVAGREGGHGLGLWVTYQIVTQLNGQIIAGGQDGETRFVVTLPLQGSTL